jgi:hypothetical protein
MKPILTIKMLAIEVDCEYHIMIHNDKTIDLTNNTVQKTFSSIFLTRFLICIFK